MPASAPDRHVFVLDTNVLIHDPAALFRFKEHDIYLPMVVLEELDAAKQGTTEVARNARQVSRFLDELIGDADRSGIEQGVSLSKLADEAGHSSGHLLLQTHSLSEELPAPLPGNNVDNSILSTTLALRKVYPQRLVTLVSKDINLRIKARILGITTEDYYTDKVLDDLDLLYTGELALPGDFWERYADNLQCSKTDGHTRYSITGEFADTCHPNQCLHHDGPEIFEALVRSIDGPTVTFEPLLDHRTERHQVWGIKARNREQNVALNLLMDPEIEFVTLLGTAGTGKTLLALAAGLAQTMEQRIYREIVMTRVTVSVGEDIGFLPGTEEEKMTPWMGALLDNLEVLTETDVGGDWGRAATEELLQKRIKIRSLNFMRGRTFFNRYVIIDEAQNLTPKQMKTLITRAGPGTKMICLGNIAQIDTPYLTGTTSGLTYVVDRFKLWPGSGHIILQRGERSRLADFASAHL